MKSDNLKLVITYGTAAIGFLGSIIAVIWTWSQPYGPNTPPRDFALIIGVLTSIIGTTGTFLFVSESATRATRAAQSSARPPEERTK